VFHKGIPTVDASLQPKLDAPFCFRTFYKGNLFPKPMAHKAALISDSSALSRTPAEAAEPRWTTLVPNYTVW